MHLDSTVRERGGESNLPLYTHTKCVTHMYIFYWKFYIQINFSFENEFFNWRVFYVMSEIIYLLLNLLADASQCSRTRMSRLCSHSPDTFDQSAIMKMYVWNTLGHHSCRFLYVCPFLSNSPIYTGLFMFMNIYANWNYPTRCEGNLNFLFSPAICITRRINFTANIRFSR